MGGWSGGVKGLSSCAEVRGRRERAEEWDLSSCAEVRGKYGLSSLMKQNKKNKNCAVFCFAGKRKIFYLFMK